MNAKGAWLKFIAADDLLLQNCIKENVEFCLSNIDVSFVFSNGFLIDEKSNFLENIGCDKKKMSMESMEQYKEMLKKYFVIAPTSFIKKETLLLVGGFNENIKMLEDYPLLLKVTKKGYKLFYLDKRTILYRQHENSVLGRLQAKNNIMHKRQWMESFVQIFDKTYFQDLARFKLYGYYLQTALLKKAYRSYINSNFLQYYFFMLMWNLTPRSVYHNIFRFRNKVLPAPVQKNHQRNEDLKEYLTFRDHNKS